MDDFNLVQSRDRIENNTMDSLNKNSFVSAKVIGTDYTYKHKIVWKNAIGFLILHLLALWGFCIMITGGVHFKTTIWVFFLIFISGEGVTTGAHRLFTHKSFKATPTLRAILIFLHTLAGQNSMFVWCRDHRLHHRYSDTDADPHNAKRGFFFSHIGWLMSKKHPYVIDLGKRIDMSDLEADWMVMFQKKYYSLLYIVIAVIIPTWVPIYYFGESFQNSLLTSYFCRYTLLLNGTWLVNSVAHLYGPKPYDRNLEPVESWFVSIMTFGEGWHNYHHVFPWDYKAAELSGHINLSAIIIEMLEKLGLAYDLKSASPVMVAKRIIRTGDGTHYAFGNEEAKLKAFGLLHPVKPTYTTAETDYLPDDDLQKFYELDVLNVTSEITNRIQT